MNLNSGEELSLTSVEPELSSLSATGATRTFRTTGTNNNATSKHAAVSI